MLYCTWLPELLGLHPVSLIVFRDYLFLRVLLVHGLAHPLQAIVTEEPLWAEKRDVVGTTCPVSMESTSPTQLFSAQSSLDKTPATSSL